MAKIYDWSNVSIHLNGQEVQVGNSINYTVKAVAIPQTIDIKDIEFNEDFIKETISDYFRGFFDDMKFLVGKYEGWPAFGFLGTRKGNEFSYCFDIRKWDNEQKDGMLYHWLESIRGEIIKGEEKILLEKTK